MEEDRRGFLKRLIGLGAATIGLLGTKGAAAAPEKQEADDKLPSYTVNIFFVAGFQYYKGVDIIRGMKEGDKLSMVTEPDNPYDPMAVRLEWNGHKIGYVPRMSNSAINILLQQNAPLDAFIKKVSHKAPTWEAVLVEARLA